MLWIVPLHAPGFPWPCCCPTKIYTQLTSSNGRLVSDCETVTIRSLQSTNDWSIWVRFPKEKWTRSVCWNYLWIEVMRVKQSFFQAGGKWGKQSRTAVSQQLRDSVCPFDYKMPVFAVSTHISLLHTTVLLQSFPVSFSLPHWGGYREQPWWSSSSLELNITRATWRTGTKWLKDSEDLHEVKSRMLCLCCWDKWVTKNWQIWKSKRGNANTQCSSFHWWTKSRKIYR